MNAEVITVGTELLLGQIIDTNAVYLSKKLAEIGVNLYYKTTVGDNKGRLKGALSIAKDRADLIIVTGGLGPTVDDITREAFAEFAGKKLVLDEGSLKKIQIMFSAWSKKMPEVNKVQAYFPENAYVIENKNGTAPGFIMEDESKFYAVMPGVPMEMHPMMEKVVIPRLLEKTGNLHKVIKYTTLKAVGLGESLINQKIEDLFKASANPSIALLAHQAEVDIRITAKADSEEQAYSMIKPLKKDIYERVGPNIFGEDEDTLESKAGELLLEKKMKISTAESCTAGLLASRLTNVAGSSGFFEGGVNTYSNESKIKILGVEDGIIEKNGAVSEECARDMAKKCAEKFGTDIAVSVTGIAGPAGGSENKPVGLVYTGINIKGDINVYKHNLPGSRNAIRARAVQMALFQLYNKLRGNK